LCSPVKDNNSAVADLDPGVQGCSPGATQVLIQPSYVQKDLKPLRTKAIMKTPENLDLFVSLAGMANEDFRGGHSA
jgi:hypothetical protein